MSVFVLRALMSVPGHVLYSSLWGYALGKAKFLDRTAGRSLVLRGFLLAIFCHGLFNLFASRLPQAALAELALVAVLWVIILRKIAEGLKLSPHRVR
jgi:RsiW-degrading membrane proteinase PrsW (M82 family)